MVFNKESFFTTLVWGCGESLHYSDELGFRGFGARASEFSYFWWKSLLFTSELGLVSIQWQTGVSWYSKRGTGAPCSLQNTKTVKKTSWIGVTFQYKPLFRNIFKVIGNCDCLDACPPPCSWHDVFQDSSPVLIGSRPHHGDSSGPGPSPRRSASPWSPPPPPTTSSQPCRQSDPSQVSPRNTKLPVSLELRRSSYIKVLMSLCSVSQSFSWNSTLFSPLTYF